MDAIELLKQHHRRIEQMFAGFLDIETGSTQEELFQKIEAELNLLVEAEARIFYSALRKHLPSKVDEALQKHARAKTILVQLICSDCNEDLFLSLFNQLMDNIRQHIDEEEGPGGLMEIASRYLDEATLLKMGAAIEALIRSTGEDLLAA